MLVTVAVHPVTKVIIGVFDSKSTAESYSDTVLGCKSPILTECPIIRHKDLSFKPLELKLHEEH